MNNSIDELGVERGGQKLMKCLMKMMIIFDEVWCCYDLFDVNWLLLWGCNDLMIVLMRFLILLWNDDEM